MHAAMQPGAARVFLDFISYSAGPLPRELLDIITVPVSILWGAATPAVALQMLQSWRLPVTQGHPCLPWHTVHGPVSPAAYNLDASAMQRPFMKRSNVTVVMLSKSGRRVSPTLCPGLQRCYRGLNCLLYCLLPTFGLP